MGEERLQLLSNSKDALDDAFSEVAAPEMACHHVFDIVPEVVFNHFVNALVTYDGELLIFYGEVNENSVSFGCLVHLQDVKYHCGAIHDVAPAMVLYMYPDFAACVCLGLSDGLYNLVLLFSGEEFPRIHQNSTFGATSEPLAALKYPVFSKSNIVDIMLRGNCRMYWLYPCAALLNFWRSTVIRFSVPSSCDCNSRKFWFALRSGYLSMLTRRRDNAPDSWSCAAWNLAMSSASRSVGSTLILVALERASMTS